MVTLQYPVCRLRVAGVCAALLLTISVTANGQETPQATQPSAGQVAVQQNAGSPSSSNATSSTPLSSSATPVKLLMGPGDEGEMSVYGMPELTTRFRVGADGEVTLPLLGSVKIGGMTANDAESMVAQKYEDGGYLKSPQITILVKEYTTQGVSVMGEIMHPGIYSALAARRLFDLFLAAGGLSPRAGRNITIQHADDKRAPDSVTLDSDLMATPETNVTLTPGDTVIVSRAGVVYVIGEVNRPGEFVITSGSRMTAMQVIAMAAGPSRYASLGKVKLMRKTADGFATTEFDLRKIMDAKAKDIALNSDDILLVPPSKGKMAAERGAGSALSLLTNLAVYRF